MADTRTVRDDAMARGKFADLAAATMSAESIASANRRTAQMMAEMPTLTQTLVDVVDESSHE